MTLQEIEDATKNRRGSRGIGIRQTEGSCHATIVRRFGGNRQFPCNQSAIERP